MLLLRVGRKAAIAAIFIVWFSFIIGFLALLLTGESPGFGFFVGKDVEIFMLIYGFISGLAYPCIVTALMGMVYYLLDYLENEVNAPQRNFLAGVVTDASDRIIGAINDSGAGVGGMIAGTLKDGGGPGVSPDERPADRTGE